MNHEFPVTKNRIYFNHAGVAPIPLRTALTIRSFTEEVLKDGAAHYEKWMARVEEVRGIFASLIQSDPKEIAFIKNTSHGLSIVANGLDWKAGENIVTVHGEFPANIYPWMNLRDRGVELRTVKPKEGRVVVGDLEKAMDENTRLLTISSVEYDTGFRNDLDTIGAMCKNKGVLFCVDAIQSLGVFPMDVKKWNIDFLAADGHKWLLAPEGLGCFYCSSEKLDLLKPPLIGWNTVIHSGDYSHYDLTPRPDAQRFEEGSLNVMGITALGASLSLILEIGVERIEERVLALTDRIVSGLVREGYRIRSPRGEGEKSGIVSFEPKKKHKNVRRTLLEKGVVCTARDGAIRVSPHFYNTEEEVEVFWEKLAEVSEDM